MKLKKMITVMMTTFIAFIACANSAQALSVNETPLDSQGKHTISHSITYVGGGNAPYTENGVQYFRSGNVIEVAVLMPKNTYAIGMGEAILYNQNQLELASDFNVIRGTMDGGLLADAWDLSVSRYADLDNGIYISAVTSGMDSSQGANVSGGAVARIRFRVKNDGETLAGTNILLQFTEFQMIGIINGTRTYFHRGYNPANHAGTAAVNLPTISLPAHKTPLPVDLGKPPVVVVPPEVEYKPSIEINKQITVEKQEEIALILKTREYSFALLNDRMNGLNLYDSIAALVMKNAKDPKDKTKFKTYSFKEENNINPKKVILEEKNCNTHFVFLLLSILLIVVTIVYNKSMEYKLQRKWGTSK